MSDQEGASGSASAPPANAAETVPHAEQTNPQVAEPMETDTAVNIQPANGETDPAAVRAQVEQEYALADAQKKLRELEDEVERVKREKAAVESERSAAGESAFSTAV
jgi:hypothetical protein